MRCGWLLLILIPFACRNYASDPTDASNNPSGGHGGQAGGGAGGSTQGGSTQGGSAQGGSAGSTGDAGSAGNGGDQQAGASGSAGATPEAGASGDGGADGSIDQQTEPVVVPECAQAGFVPNTFSALAASLTWDANAPQLYGSDAASNSTIARWADVNSGRWFQWLCFDSLPTPTRLASTNLSNKQPEFFAITADGAIHVRRGYPISAWTEWTPFSPPFSNSFLTDVAVTPDLVHVYVIDRGNVFLRTKASTDPYSSYGGWAALPANKTAGSTPQARLLAAVELPNFKQEVFTVNNDTVWAIKETATGSPQYEDWRSLGAPGPHLVDLDSAVDSGGNITLDALGSDGSLWSRSESTSGVWQQVIAAGGPVHVVTVTTLGDGIHGPDVPAVYGASIHGVTYQLTGTAWEAL